MSHQLHIGDNVATLRNITDNTIDSIITDPPYGIEFLDKDWDSNTGAIECWRECLRVLKPGGYLLAFSAARTYHHLATNIEAVGFEIRDQIMWIYASGFPKSQQVKGHTGWKTALKPAHEPIVMARKPIPNTVKANMDKWGVGALNIDESRVAFDGVDTRQGGVNGWSRTEFGEREPIKYKDQKPKPLKKGKDPRNRLIELEGTQVETKAGETDEWHPNERGRYPSNVLGDIPDYQKYYYCPKVSRKERHCGFDIGDKRLCGPGGDDFVQIQDHHRSNNLGNNHPTVKPVDLMRYLIKLVTPDDSTVLDPFCGSGSTGMAAVELGHHFIGCEIDPNYVEIAQKRIQSWTNKS